jgi:hypothetical protein
MDRDTLLHLKSLGVTEPLCQQCLSEDFKYFKVFNNQVLCCDRCFEQLKESEECLQKQSGYLSSLLSL